MILKNVSYVDLINEKVITNVDIEISDGKIKEIGQNLCGEYIDCSSKLIVPTFTNAHTHLGMSMMRNYSDDLELQDWLEKMIWPFEAKLTEEDIYWASKLSVLESLKNGVGNVVDMYDHLDMVVSVCKEAKIKAVLARGVMDIFGGGEARIDEFKSNFRDFNSEKVKIILGPHAIYTCSKDYLIECLNVSKQYGQMLHIHVSETKKEVEDCLKENGVRVVEYLKSLGYLDTKIIAAHCVHLDDNEIERIENTKFYPIYNPVSNLKLASGFTPIKKMLDAGLVVGIGTDSSASNNNLSILKELQVGAIVNKNINGSSSAVKTVDLLKMATINGAKITGFNNGSIEVGKDADFNFFDLNSINFTPNTNDLIAATVYSAMENDITDVMIDGEFVVRDRNVLTIDEEEVKYKLNMLTQKILRS